MLARVKQEYAAGAVMAFSGREYVRGEWREVPAGFEEQARNHPLLEIQPSLEEVRAGNAPLPGLGKSTEPPPAVTVETEETPAAAEPTESPAEEPETKPAEEDASSKTPRSRRGKRAAGE